MKKTGFLFLFLIHFNILNGQDAVLDRYISMALDSNLALMQKYHSFEKSLAEAEEARGLYYPDLQFNARYSVAEGGRTIDFPVGDLLNPVYQTLNDITGRDAFSTVNNQTFQFYRPTEQVTKLQLIQSIFNPQIYYNYRIKKELSLSSKADYDSYRRFVVCEVKTAFANYLKSHALLELYERTKSLLEENIRVNRKLLENDKVTLDNLYRSQAELSKLVQKISDAKKFLHTSRAYFNFLVNRPLGNDISADTDINTDFTVPSLDECILRAQSDRAELTRIQSFRQISGYREKMDRSNRLPKVFGSVDYGVQGVDYSIDANADFILGSVVLQWDLFAGFQNNHRIQ